ncbi:hypothetical protein SK128_004534 [Halocaridina rubra]|uniref:Uncharacterized protein n=1 Tax=Halocaridina rubra TaxID=373956 RepID=A0AAN8XJ90_HALRR
MFRTGRGIAACFGGARARIKWTIQTEHPSLTFAAIATTSKKLQTEEDTLEDLKTKTNLANSKDVSTLLHSCVQHNSSARAYQVLQTLSDLVEVKKIDFKKDVEQDVNFSKLLSLIERESSTSSPLIVLTGLKNLLKLGISPEAYVVHWWCGSRWLLPLEVGEEFEAIRIPADFYAIGNNESTPMEGKLVSKYQKFSRKFYLF